MLAVGKIHTFTIMMGRNDVSRGESRKMTQLPEKLGCLLREVEICLDPKILKICTMPYNLQFDDIELNMKARSG